MSFAKTAEKVQLGDTVVLYLGHNVMQSFKIQYGAVHQTKFGAFPHNSMIGKEYGSKLYSTNNRGWVHIFHSTPELWTATLPHRTQILYTTDISLVTFELELKPGSVVIESGTGSGSISHAFLRTIMPSGHLHTFDFHQQRTDQAREDFESHGLKDYVTGSCRDVCSDGFGLSDVADAVFLDLPRPWDVIKFAKVALKASGGRLCSFSPCIEQVQRTCLHLRRLGFCEIKTVECLCKTQDVKLTALPRARLGKKDSDEQQSREEEKAAVDEAPSSELISPSLKRPHSELTDKNFGVDLKKQKPGFKNMLTCRTIKEIPGHTGYLTFATLLPPFVQN